MSTDKPRRLGRGLEALIASAAHASTGAPETDLHRVPIARIRPNPYQPRRDFDPAELAELAESLKQSGLLQPITVRPRGDAYELIAGERRLRAADSLGWTEISAIVRDFDDRTMLVLALVENLQRTNLNALEEAQGFRRLIDEFGLTQQQVADAVGKDRTTITNMLRVLSLPAAVQRLIEGGHLTTGHARALLTISDGQTLLTVANESVAKGWSVRELERRARDFAKPDTSTKKVASGRPKEDSTSPVSRQIEDELRRYLQTDVRLDLADKQKGTVRIAFYSGDDLERLLELIIPGRRDQI